MKVNCILIALTLWPARLILVVIVQFRATMIDLLHGKFVSVSTSLSKLRLIETTTCLKVTYV